MINNDVFIYVGVFVLVVVFITITSSLFIVEQQKVALIERLGKFSRISGAGLHFLTPFIEKVSGVISLRIKQLDVLVETKTQDNVFIDIMVSVQYKVLPNKVYEAFYTLDNAEKQIQSFVFDVVRARVPLIDLDDVFSKKDEIAISVKDELQEVMNNFGYNIIKTLVTDIKPDSRVKTAMNEINEAQRLRVASMERGEAEKILKVKQAEAEAESKILQGKGMAGQRRAIMDGLRESLDEFQKQIGDADPHDAMTLIMMAQYFDTIKDLGLHSNQNTILIPHSPGGMNDLFNQIRNSIITGNKMSDDMNSNTSEKKSTKKSTSASNFSKY
ncbi:SPFH domain-containing protein [Candidatus Nesciobacter abundans]|uniref:SPFH domain-containing protein n=1 Tax=Candidatus Nesciobacter abundans TaxID=2601668 RepID=A0A5C0UGA9_9PROT|nr:SPFH domain-containing protein [Candidatus Nesciobacter abundans]QEK39145.1 SPFH domain-containing protein [Candidatus Nesciobacter abundans]